MNWTFLFPCFPPLSRVNSDLSAIDGSTCLCRWRTKEDDHLLCFTVQGYHEVNSFINLNGFTVSCSCEGLG